LYGLLKAYRPPTRRCGSPTTPNVDSVTARRAGEAIETLLLAPMLRPMIAGAGMLGDYELDLLAGEIARHDAHGFAALIASRLERAP
jgi:hypothetical protein